MHSSRFLRSLLLPLALLPYAYADFSLTETSTTVTLANSRFTAVLTKASASITKVYLDGQDLLGPASGSIGKGPYADCYCIPSGFFTIGSSQPKYTIVNGTDSTGTPYGGIILADTYAPTGQQFEQYWFVRGEETGLHMFTRIKYDNEQVPFLRNLQELRTLFRPNTPLWTHLAVTDDQWAPLPGKEAVSKQKVVQDATWSLAATPADKYFQQASEFFTKYTFSNDWKNVFAHGMYADGSTSNGTSYGAWTVMNNKETYYGGPLHSDLTVDGIVYNYIVSNHHGEGTPNITHGFDRTYGPNYLHFNSHKTPTPVDPQPGTPPSTLKLLRSDAAQYANAQWNAKFYDSIAKHVPGYAPSSRRGALKGKVNLPKGAKNPVAVLSASGMHFQDNAAAPHAYQYWEEINPKNGQFEFDRVVDGEYRLTVYADGVFGEFYEDNIVVKAGKTATKNNLKWKEESSGTELWRIGTPDKSSGEFRHGNAQDPTHPIGLKEHLIYWGAYDFPTDFPTGVNFTIGQSDPAKDLNYVHWAVFGQTASRPGIVASTAVNEWTINFKLTSSQLKRAKTATLTIQLAGAKTAAGNTDVARDGELYNDLPLVAKFNGYSGPETTLVVPWYKSSSCAVRSAVSCYQVGEKLKFAVSKGLKVGWNQLVLALPYNGTNIETAVLPTSIYVQYDALRLEID